MKINDYVEIRTIPTSPNFQQKTQEIQVCRICGYECINFIFDHIREKHESLYLKCEEL